MSPKIDFDWEKEVESDIISDLNDDSMSISWISPLSPLYDEGTGSILPKEHINSEYRHIQSSGTYNEFDRYWDAKMRQQKREKRSK